ncbi:MAG: methionyl-tRNA formyltransferase [Oscillospiraceae bacterium]
MRILFMGTPDFAVESLSALFEAGHNICGVFTQPDKPKNRGMKLTPTPVKEYAITHNIPVFQPVKLRDGTAMAQIQAWAPELIVVAAYGRLLPDDILDYPPKGCINVHSSLLPKYRGAAPINWAVLNGDSETGVTIMHMATELDAGDIISTVTTAIDPDETVETLYARLAKLGGKLLAESVSRIADGTASRVAQDGSRKTLAPMLDRALSPMDWEKTARVLHNQVRGLIPWPCAETVLDGVRCKVFATSVLEESTEKAPGTILKADKNGLHIACGAGTVLKLEELQPDGKKRMPATAFLQGHPIGL